MTHFDSEQKYPDTHHDVYSKTVFGFWMYLLTDFILFGTFFASYVVLREGTYGGPSAKVLFDLKLALIQTLILLICSFTSGLAGVYAHRKNKNGTTGFFILTFLLGIVFTVMQFQEFGRLINSGNSWQRSAFLSAFFTLVGTHIAHILFALLWILVLLLPVIRDGLTSINIRRLTCLRMFWQFLNIVWVFIFTIIYCGG